MIGNQLLQGDCLEVMRGLPDNSVDAVVTDPPYGLSFMGAKWDYDVPRVEVGVSVSTVNNWDQGRTGPRMTARGMARLMKAYDCTFEELLAAEGGRKEEVATDTPF